jgi:hypothetical protein
MRRPPSRVHRLLPLSAEAWAAAEELGTLAGMSPGQFVENTLIELLGYHGSRPTPDGEPLTSDPSGVIPISRARQKRRPGTGGPRAS